MFVKMNKGLPPIRKQTLSKETYEKNGKIKGKVHTDNRNRNDWNFQLHWNKLEWVHPRSKTVRKTIFNLFRKN